MAEKILDLGKTVHALCTTDPGILPILAQAGFSEIAKPGMLNTAGRFMTIPKGAAMRKLDLDAVKRLFSEHGYTIKED